MAPIMASAKIILPKSAMAHSRSAKNVIDSPGTLAFAATPRGRVLLLRRSSLQQLPDLHMRPPPAPSRRHIADVN